MKKYIALFLIALFAIALLSGCSTTEFVEDYLEIHGDFLHYSLGGYVVIAERNRRVADSPIIGHFTEFIEWELQFERRNGEERVLHLTNRQTPFAHQIIRFAEEHAARDLAREVLSDYFTAEELGMDSEASTNAWVSLRFQGDNLERESVIHPQTGLQLYSVTPQELIDDWGFSFRVVVRSYDPEQYTLAIERLQAAASALADYLGQDQIGVSFALFPGRAPAAIADQDRSFSGHYCRQRDTFEIDS